jgi:hypothetical protein
MRRHSYINVKILESSTKEEKLNIVIFPITFETHTCTKMADPNLDLNRARKLTGENLELV